MVIELKPEQEQQIVDAIRSGAYQNLSLIHISYFRARSAI